MFLGNIIDDFRKKLDTVKENYKPWTMPGTKSSTSMIPQREPSASDSMTFPVDVNGPIAKYTQPSQVDRGDTPHILALPEQIRQNAIEQGSIRKQQSRQTTSGYTGAVNPEVTQLANADKEKTFKEMSNMVMGSTGELKPLGEAVVPTIRGIAKKTTQVAKELKIPKTVRVWIKSKFSDSGAFTDVPVLRKENNITLYQGGSNEGRQFWTPNESYAAQFGEVTKKTGNFFKIDNGNRLTDVYVEAEKHPQLAKPLVRRVIPKVDIATQKEMIDVINYARLKPGFDQKLEENAGVIAEKYGVKGKTMADIANKFDDMLQRIKTTKGYPSILKR